MLYASTNKTYRRLKMKKVEKDIIQLELERRKSQPKEYMKKQEEK